MWTVMVTSLGWTYLFSSVERAKMNLKTAALSWFSTLSVLQPHFVITQVQLTLFAELSRVAGEAETGEGVDSIQTGGSVQTRVRLALVDICRHTRQACIISSSFITEFGGQCGEQCVPVSQSCPVYPGAHTQIFCAPFL